MERLQKILSAAGVCSRRLADEYLKAGRVTINGCPALLGEKADVEHDEIALDGVVINYKMPPKVYLMLNKPEGYVTTLADEFGRPAVVDLTRDCGQRVYPIGRLDRDSEGLLLLTNDGNFAQRLCHPSYETEKEYRVTVTGNLRSCVERLESMRMLDGCPIAPVQVRVLERLPGKWVLSMVLHQGLNRQIRRMCKNEGMGVRQLIRVREGAMTLGGLEPGKWRYLTPEEVEAAYHYTYRSGGKEEEL
ncbi:MAG: rRNA pseudouridine synthase [Oscillospiraceae bacterium]|nr:rRNA pseudouridine synthase [Oscillospiraceae bacterium]